MTSAWAAAVCCSAAALLSGQTMPRCEVTPGWTQAGATRTYRADTLYDYMDGNSEGYLIYGFQQMSGITCKSGETSLVIDISEMDDAESAYGLYASNRDPRLPVEALGISGQVAPQRGIFVKGKRFVEISASPASVDHSTQIRSFLKALEPHIEGTVAVPAAVNWFPKPGLDSASIRLIPESVLGLRALKRGYVATYDYGRAFVVKQASPTTAEATMGKLRQRFAENQPATFGDEGFQANDKYLGRLLFFRKGNWIAGLANLKEGFAPELAARSLEASLP